MNGLGTLLTFKLWSANSVAPVYCDVVIFSLSVLDIFHLLSRSIFHPFSFVFHVDWPMWAASLHPALWHPAGVGQWEEAPAVGGRWVEKEARLFIPQLSLCLALGRLHPSNKG